MHKTACTLTTAIIGERKGTWKESVVDELRVAARNGGGACER